MNLKHNSRDYHPRKTCNVAVAVKRMLARDACEVPKYLMRKILLYEPGKEGHRPVIVEYVRKVLCLHGIEVEQAPEALYNEPWALAQHARKTAVEIIFVLTADGIPVFLAKLSAYARLLSVKVICNYYLFNNLIEGWKSFIWKSLLSMHLISLVQISDDDGVRTGKYPSTVRFLPDPWDPDTFQVEDQRTARTKLGLPTTGVCFIMVGVLDKRKGADLLAAAVSRLRQEALEDPVFFVFAGLARPETRAILEALVSREGSSPTVIFRDGHVPEEQFPLYFSACDYVVCAYESAFKVSSNTVTRGLAAARPIIAPSHGVNSSLVSVNKCGLLFDTGSVASLTEILYRAIRYKLFENHLYKAMSNAAQTASCHRTLAVYGEFLLKNITDCCEL